MTPLHQRALLGTKALFQLGWKSVWFYAVYHIGLSTGFWRWRTPIYRYKDEAQFKFGTEITHPKPTCNFPMRVPSVDQLTAILGSNSAEVLAEADEICEGKIRLFGGPPIPLNLVPNGKLHHWTAYERGQIPWESDDVKFIWEPARFGWVYSLGQAYILAGNEKYPETFWQHTQTFIHGNPINLGPNWASAQEVALRLLALLFATRVFETSRTWTPEHQDLLNWFILRHAERIPPTMCYARAQNNNHLLVEALGLYAAGISYPDYPPAHKWRDIGWHFLNQALLTQISSDGTYTQHSTNYHRLMLQAALWAEMLNRHTGNPLPPEVYTKLKAASTWLATQLDTTSGQVPNLGHNDGAYILPLAPGGFSDYRPVIQAACRAFLKKACLPAGPWDTFSLWLSLPVDNENSPTSTLNSPAVHRLGNSRSWATLRAARFTARPAHADQLHVDLWWQGINIACDAGTFSYNLPSPRNNSFAQTVVHNTITVSDQDQMLRAGRFLWLDWAQARLLSENRGENRLKAEHNGYRRLGLIHQRSLFKLDENNWHIQDLLLPLKTKSKPYTVIIHWLLPDFKWDVSSSKMIMHTSLGDFSVEITPIEDSKSAKTEITGVQVIHSGESLYGAENAIPTLGWYSPIYGMKLPAVSFRVTLRSTPPLTILSQWVLSR